MVASHKGTEGWVGVELDSSSCVPHGHRASLAQGKHFMAHHCGFMLKVLMGTLKAAGFGAVVGSRRGAPYFDLWVLACPGGIDEANLRRLALAHFPA